MIPSLTPFNQSSKLGRLVSVSLALVLFATPLCAQQPSGSQAKPSPVRAAQKRAEKLRVDRGPDARDPVNGSSQERTAEEPTGDSLA